MARHRWRGWGAPSAWWTFTLLALVPLTFVAALAWRARSAAIVEAREAESARLARAAVSAKEEVDGRLAEARRILSALGDGDPRVPVTPAGMVAFVLDSSGALVSPSPPPALETPPSSCLDARAALFGPERAAARTTIVTSCPTLRSESGRYLWPLLVLEDGADAARLPAWLAQHGARLSDSERATLRARLAGVDPSSREQAVAHLTRPANDAVSLQALLERHDAQTSEGALWIRRRSYVAILRTIADGRTAGLVMNARSLDDAPPALPADVALEEGGAPVASFVVAPELAFHLVAKDPRASDARIARAGNVVVGLAAASVVVALGFAAILYARFLRARDLAELRTDFVAAVSHELRTPASTVLMLTELLEQRAIAEEERPAIEASLAGEARRLSETLTRMLRFGALSRGKLTATRSVVNLRTVADDAVRRFLRQHPARRVEVQVDDALEARVDAGLFGLALDNLLGNAAKYAPAGDPYELSIRGEGDVLVLSVGDHGPGLDREALERVFLPFERADARLSKATEGTGIGLTLVRGIAEAHGGTARGESVLGKGATFIIEVPWKRS